jgi:hypothetical protein
MGAPTVKVLFIGGYGRSGSTLLDRMLGQVEGFCSSGELRHVFREGYVENRLCGCGTPFRSCPFWGEVTEEAFGGIAAFDPAAVLRLQERVDRWWRVPQLAWGVGSSGRAAELARYRALLRRLYLAIAAVSGARVIVDSSKDVSHGYVLRGVGEPVETYVLHLVRDSRAVAHSWQRKKFNPGSGADMQRYTLLRTSAEWSAINALTSLHGRLDRSRYRLLRYRELTADPPRAIRAALELVGESERADPFSAADTLVLGTDHTAAGNPVRFHTGPMTVHPDEEWRRRMASGGRALVTALTLPALLRYR